MHMLTVHDAIWIFFLLSSFSYRNFEDSDDEHTTFQQNKTKAEVTQTQTIACPFLYPAMDTWDYNSVGLQYMKFLLMGEDQKRGLGAVCLRMGEDIGEHRSVKLGYIVSIVHFTRSHTKLSRYQWPSVQPCKTVYFFPCWAWDKRNSLKKAWRK